MMSKDKGKQVAIPTPLSSPSTGSTSPASSLSALWSYLFPALDHIVRSQVTAEFEKISAPSIAVDYHMGVHTNVYNYFTAQSESANGTKKDRSAQISGKDLYEQLDKYYADTARELLLGAPDDDATLIHYLVPCFNRYNAGASSVNRLLNYVNRHYVKRAVDEDKGWLRLNDVFDAVAKTITDSDTREKISKRLRERKTEELKMWGYEDGGSAELLAEAEACAEAASSLDRIVPLSSLALRRFRIECVEPLLKVPKIKVKGRKKRSPPTNGEKGLMPKGRLARAIKELLETQGGDEDEKCRLAVETATMLKTVGVRADQPLRKKLDKFVIAATV
ncbi:hypothetical protein PILCRDRAFT_818280 [Piloderma croceum F 1598]|uniref:Uncharacterized protein n=1 Tax=Piloderma croceum (strain F 1598) TaxID=765440 RepID=A0A0C3C4Y7_PILCF|nr:hypothetical protein PILCRDRAFT_818280 [Piloderma croceum F 1598]